MHFYNGPLRAARWTSMCSDSPSEQPRPARARPAWLRFLMRFFAWVFGLAFAAVAAAICVGAVALAVAYPNLPDIGDLSDYRPKLPMRVFSADNVLLGEFGEERRNLTPI